MTANISTGATRLRLFPLYSVRHIAVANLDTIKPTSILLQIPQEKPHITLFFRNQSTYYRLRSAI